MSNKKRKRKFLYLISGEILDKLFRITWKKTESIDKLNLHMRKKEMK